ncbi:MAG: glycosyltransferase family 39 protein [Saprospiraceae bacterium]
MRSSFLLPKLTFWVLLFVLLWLGQVPRYIDSPPISRHSWRQSDSAAQFFNFYKYGTPLWEPQTMTLKALDGHAASELPITYWLAAQPARWFGFSEAWLRGFHLLIFMGGLWCFYLLCRRLLQDDWLALGPPLLYAASPIILFYSYTSLPVGPGVALMLVAWYLFWRFIQSGGAGWLLLTTLVAALATLIRPSEGIHFVAMIGTLFFTHLFYRKSYPLPFSSGRAVLYGSCLLFFGLCVYTWVNYVEAYSQQYHYFANLQGILPYWNENAERVAWIDRMLTAYFFKEVMGRPLWWVIIIMAGTLLFNPRTYRDPFGIATILLLIGGVAYYFLFYGAFDLHDYYLIPMFLPMAFVTIAWMRAYLDLIPSPLRKWIAYSGIAALIIYGFVYAAGSLAKRFPEIHTGPQSAQLFGIDEALTAMGVPADAKIISIPDFTPNISLYLTKRQGETDFMNGTLGDLAPYAEWADYVVINRPEIIAERPGVQDDLGRLVGTYQGTEVYEIRKPE